MTHEAWAMVDTVPADAPRLALTRDGFVVFSAGEVELYRCRYEDAVAALGRLVAQVVADRESGR